MSSTSKEDASPNPLEKPGYLLEFHDEFDGNNLDRSKWHPYYLPQWSSRQQSRPNYELKDNCLVLQITESQAPWCPEFDGQVKASSIQSGVFAEPLGSTRGQHRFDEALVVREEQRNERLYTPQYGYFEVRAKALDTPGNHVSAWMIGYEEEPHQSAEVAIFEIFGAMVGSKSSRVGYGLHPWGDPQIRDEFYEVELAIDATRFHIYGVEWTQHQLDFYIDNRKTRTLKQSPDYPMQFMLSIYQLPAETQVSADKTADLNYPREFWIDYLRAYQPLGGY